MTFNLSLSVPGPIADAREPERLPDGTASIASQLKSGFSHDVSALWQAERQLHKVIMNGLCNEERRSLITLIVHVHLSDLPFG